MPIYEYVCGSCGYEMEAKQRFSDHPLTKCPECEQDSLERLVSQTSFALKGEGWYADGYGGKKADGADEKAGGGDEKAEGGDKKAEGGDGKADGGAKKADAPAGGKEATPKTDTKKPSSD